MLTDDLRARVNAEAERRWPHLEVAGEVTNEARAVRRLTFRQGVDWAMGHTTSADVEPQSVELIEVWLWNWYDRVAGPGESWTFGDLAAALREHYAMVPLLDVAPESAVQEESNGWLHRTIT